MENTVDKRTALRKKAMALPLTPGVYLMKDARGHIIYIGKAKALKNRVSQYFGSDANHTPKVRRMVSRVEDFDYILADSEFEALVLECSLIKQHTPKYNILLKDDKGYSYIRISPPPFSRITAALQKEEDGARYIGPYVSSYAVRQAVDEACKVFGLSTCRLPLAVGKKAQPRPCLNHHIGQCCAPCTGKVSEAAYAERVEGALQFLQKGSVDTLRDLEHAMREAAENLEFEKAAKLRDRINAIKRMNDRQKVVMSHVKEQDVMALAQGSEAACFEVFRFAGGSLYDREHFLMDEIDDATAARSEFLRRYYTMRQPPAQITLDGDCEDMPLLAEWLSEVAGRRVSLVLPQKGEQAKLVEMCRHNAAERIAQQAGMAGRDAAALDELARLLGLPHPPTYIECYDISHTAGQDTVAGMVVFQNGRPLKSAFRRFAIREAAAGDDYAAMQEVLHRRLTEYVAYKEEGTGFGRKPDLILLDGGAGHVAACRPVVDGFALNIPVYGLVKDDAHRTRAIAADGGEIAIRSKRTAFTLLSSIQEEVHRFAITYHRQKRKQNSIGTVLTRAEGIGEARARALLRHFGSLRAIRAASMEELAAVKGMSVTAAQALKLYLDNN